MSPNVDEIETAMWSLPPQTRCAMLTASLIECDNEAVAAVLALLNCSGAMAQLLSRTRRYAIAEKMRDTADAVERRHEGIAAAPSG
jgi:hypothetical protein